MIRRIFLNIIIIILAFTLQVCVFPIIDVVACWPNLLLIVVSICSFIDGRECGILYGLVAGLLRLERRIHPFLELSCRFDLHLRFPLLIDGSAGRPVPPTSLALWTGGGARRPAEPWLKSWGRYRSGTSPESHTPQYSSQDSALGVDMENTGIAVSPFIFRAKKFLPHVPRLRPPHHFPQDREGPPDPIQKNILTVYKL